MSLPAVFLEGEGFHGLSKSTRRPAVLLEGGELPNRLGFHHPPLGRQGAGYAMTGPFNFSPHPPRRTLQDVGSNPKIGKRIEDYSNRGKALSSDFSKKSIEKVFPGSGFANPLSSFANPHPGKTLSIDFLEKSLERASPRFVESSILFPIFGLDPTSWRVPLECIVAGPYGGFLVWARTLQEDSREGRFLKGPSIYIASL